MQHEGTLFAGTPHVHRTDEPVDHQLFSGQWINGEKAPSVGYELKPVRNPATDEVMDNCFYAVVTLNNPKELNSYTTDMCKGVIEAVTTASLDRRVKAVVFTGTGDYSFCTGGNTGEYSAWYALRPEEYMTYMQLFIKMVDCLLECRKPVICRANGMRMAGGQEIGMACDFTLASDLAIFGQAGPRHGSAAVGGSSDFLNHLLSIELAMWNCVSCVPLSAYEMLSKDLISDAFPVLRQGDLWIPNPQIITDLVAKDGKNLLGKFKIGDEFKAGKALIKAARDPELSHISIDFALLDKEVETRIWHLSSLFPGCVMQTLYQLRSQKAATWNERKFHHMMWLGANMGGEAAMGFAAFANRNATGRVDQVNWSVLQTAISNGEMFDANLVEQIMPTAV